MARIGAALPGKSQLRLSGLTGCDWVIPWLPRIDISMSSA